MSPLDVFSPAARAWFEQAFEGPTPAQELGANNDRRETRKGRLRVAHRCADDRHSIVGERRIRVKHTNERRARLGHTAIDRRRPSANRVLDQAGEPALAYKRPGVVLAAAIDDNDLRRRWSQDSE